MSLYVQILQNPTINVYPWIGLSYGRRGTYHSNPKSLMNKTKKSLWVQQITAWHSAFFLCMHQYEHSLFIHVWTFGAQCRPAFTPMPVWMHLYSQIGHLVNKFLSSVTAILQHFISAHMIPKSELAPAQNPVGPRPDWWTPRGPSQ